MIWKLALAFLAGFVAFPLCCAGAWILTMWRIEQLGGFREADQVPNAGNS